MVSLYEESDPECTSHDNASRGITPCLAYVLDDASHFCYDLLLGQAWLKKFKAMPQWRDDSYKLTDPTTDAHF